METYNDVPTIEDFKANSKNYIMKVVDMHELENITKADSSNDTAYSPKECDKGYYCEEGQP